ncbi:MAG: anthranilate phosphoribosyltransferase [Thermodesulfovibrionales bacterium]|nr:anthranilate phosphoribosyltransferase [Thermodesulfovibrionales bacterium]
MIREAIKLLVQNIGLSEAEMTECMGEIMEGKATDAQIASFLTALRMKGENTEEITAAARVMREKAIKIKAPEGVIDTCGTGGDMAGTFNISTTTALVVAASGLPVAKHGNRSVSSLSGSADVLEALGIKVDLPPEKVEKCLFETNFGFLFAPMFHPAMKYAISARREISISTIFNLLGPLTNPAGAKKQLIGIFSSKLTELLANVLTNLGVEDAMVVHGEDGLDEITICDATKISRTQKGKVETFYIVPEQFGLKRANRESLIGGNKDVNADITVKILQGYEGPKRDIVLLNASAAILLGGIASDFKVALEIAKEAIDSRKALEKLQEVREITNKL